MFREVRADVRLPLPILSSWRAGKECSTCNSILSEDGYLKERKGEGVRKEREEKTYHQRIPEVLFTHYDDSSTILQVSRAPPTVSLVGMSFQVFRIKGRA